MLLKPPSSVLSGDEIKTVLSGFSMARQDPDPWPLPVLLHCSKHEGLQTAFMVQPRFPSAGKSPAGSKLTELASCHHLLHPLCRGWGGRAGCSQRASTRAKAVRTTLAERGRLVSCLPSWLYWPSPVMHTRTLVSSGNMPDQHRCMRRAARDQSQQEGAQSLTAAYSRLTQQLWFLGPQETQGFLELHPARACA